MTYLEAEKRGGTPCPHDTPTFVLAITHPTAPDPRFHLLTTSGLLLCICNYVIRVITSCWHLLQLLQHYAGQKIDFIAYRHLLIK